jgi:small subunit ribosomal protein S16
MAVRIRLKRIGRRNRPFYRMCVFDGRTRRDGRPVEELGSYDPRGTTLSEKINVNRQRAHYWLSVGAQPSETCKSLLRKLGVYKGGPVPVDEPEAAAVEAVAEAPVAAAAETDTEVVADAGAGDTPAPTEPAEPKEE